MIGYCFRIRPCRRGKKLAALTQKKDEESGIPNELASAALGPAVLC